jgi:hypothetical protein
MATRIGRVEKRIRLEVPMQISGLQKRPSADLTEKTITENVSTHGARVVNRHPLSPHERLLVSSHSGRGIRTSALVVYCQPLANGLFGVGLQFQDTAFEWEELPPRDSLA